MPSLRTDRRIVTVDRTEDGAILTIEDQRAWGSRLARLTDSQAKQLSRWLAGSETNDDIRKYEIWAASEGGGYRKVTEVFANHALAAVREFFTGWPSHDDVIVGGPSFGNPGGTIMAHYRRGPQAPIAISADSVDAKKQSAAESRADRLQDVINAEVKLRRTTERDKEHAERHARAAEGMLIAAREDLGRAEAKLKALREALDAIA